MKIKKSVLLLTLIIGTICNALALTCKQDSSDYLKFKNAYENKIKESDRKIAELKNKFTKEDRETKRKYDLKITGIENTNDELRERLAIYKENDSNWDQFKNKFRQDTDQLEKELDELSDWKK